MNEETIIKNSPMANDQQGEANNQADAWKLVTLGGVSGVLMGAGLLYAGQVVAKDLEKEETPEVKAPEEGETSHTLENGLQVAAVSEDFSFGEAFAAARAEVGPGGVFHWHGGIYNTYTADEWNSMTIAQKHDFAQQVRPEIHPDELSTPTDANSQVVVVHHVYHHETAASTSEEHQPTDDVQVARNNTDDDVHIVGYGNVQGHMAVGVDVTGDGDADIAIIDVDDDRQLSEPDIVVDKEGNMATVGEIVSAQDPSLDNYADNPDMPDTGNTDADLPLFDV